MKDNVNAMTDYQHAIQLDDTYSLAYFNAANIYFHSRRFKQVFCINFKNICDIFPFLLIH